MRDRLSTTIFMGTLSRMLSVSLPLVTLVVIQLSPLVNVAVAQESPAIRDIGAVDATLEGDWLVSTKSEAIEGRDLNGDGDTDDEVFHAHDLKADTTTNLRLAVRAGSSGEFDALPARISGGRAELIVDERAQGRGDLNGDGDAEDWVVHVHDLVTDETTNLKLAVEFDGAYRDWMWRSRRCRSRACFSSERLIFAVSERAQGEDLNGDGDSEDAVVHSHDLSTGVTTNLGARFADVFDSWLVYLVPESFANQDLNGDGDRADWILHVQALSTGEIRKTRLASGPLPGDWAIGVSHGVSGNWLAFSVSEELQGDDLNGDGDTEDAVVHVHNLADGTTTNLRLNGLNMLCSFACYSWVPLYLSGDWLVFFVPESEGLDLNGDGDTEDSVVHVSNLADGTTSNLGLCVGIDSLWDPYPLVLSEKWLVFTVPELAQGEDMNGDGDTEDWVVHTHNLAGSTTTNLRLANDKKAGFLWRDLILSEDWLVFLVSESAQGEDLNGDGRTDEIDRVVHVHNLAENQTTNLRLASEHVPETLLTFGDRLVIGIDEHDPGLEGEDLNGDGDTDDLVYYVHDLAEGTTTLVGEGDDLPFDLLPLSSFDARNDRWFLARNDRWFVYSVSERLRGEDLNGDGDIEDRIAHVRNQVTGSLTNLRLAGSIYPDLLSGDWLVLVEFVGSVRHFHLVDLTRLAELPTYRRGDCDDDGTVDLSDAVCILGWLFLGQAEPGCRAVANVNGGGGVDISDPIYLLTHLFLGGPAPAQPFPDCGFDTSPNEVDTCETPSANCPP